MNSRRSPRRGSLPLLHLGSLEPTASYQRRRLRDAEPCKFNIRQVVDSFPHSPHFPFPIPRLKPPLPSVCLNQGDPPFPERNEVPKNGWSSGPETGEAKQPEVALHTASSFPSFRPFHLLRFLPVTIKEASGSRTFSSLVRVKRHHRVSSRTGGQQLAFLTSRRGCDVTSFCACAVCQRLF